MFGKSNISVFLPEIDVVAISLILESWYAWSLLRQIFQSFLNGLSDLKANAGRYSFFHKFGIIFQLLEKLFDIHTFVHRIPVQHLVKNHA